jgi:hypothetical protein
MELKPWSLADFPRSGDGALSPIIAMNLSITDATVSAAEEKLRQQLREAESLAAEAWQKFLCAPFALKGSIRRQFRAAEERCEALRRLLAAAGR